MLSKYYYQKWVTIYSQNEKNCHHLKSIKKLISPVQIGTHEYICEGLMPRDQLFPAHQHRTMSFQTRRYKDSIWNVFIGANQGWAFYLQFVTFGYTKIEVENVWNNVLLVTFGVLAFCEVGTGCASD